MQLSDVLSIQLYSLRSMENLDAILDAVKAAGITKVETIGSHLDNAVATRAALNARGLAATTGHVNMPALREKLGATVLAARTLGIETLYMPSVPGEQRGMDAAGWTAMGRELGALAKSLAREGLALGYHNHNWEMDKKDGDLTALDLLFAAAEGSGLSWEADVAWLVRGGADPKAVMSKYKHLVTAAHVKDIAPAGQCLDEDGWADVGHGVLDWKDLWAFCRGLGARWMVLEHDKPSDAPRFARRSADYLRAAVA